MVRHAVPAGGTLSPLLQPLGVGKRAMLFGQTGSGKSTFAATLADTTYKSTPRLRVVILDLKRRYFPNGSDVLFPDGVKARLVGKRIGIPSGGVIVNGTPSLMDRRKRIWVVQGLRNILVMLDWLYNHSDARKPTLIFADETNRLMDGARAKAVYETMLSEGREMNVGGIAIHQRPRNLTRSLLTESERLYIGHLNAQDDIDYLSQQTGYKVPRLDYFEWLGIDQEHGVTLRFRTEI